MLSRVIPCLLLLSLAAAVGQEPAKEADTPKVKPTGIYYQFGIYYAPAPSKPPFEAAREIVKTQFEGRITYRDDSVKLEKGTYVVLREVGREEYAPPSETYLQHKGFGLTEAQRKALQDTATVLLIDVFEVKPDNLTYLTHVNELAAAIAEVTGGFVWDEETRELYAVKAWRQKRLPDAEAAVPPILANTTMHAYALPSENYRAVTLGMRKAGLPDLVVSEFPKAFWDPIMAMMRFLTTEVARGGPLNPRQQWKAGELKKQFNVPNHLPLEDISLVPAGRVEGDPENDLWMIDFSAYPGENLHDQQAHLIERAFPPRQDILMEVWEERDEIMKLSEKAREQLKTKRDLFKKELAPKERLLVKAFVNGEYLWVDVKKWEEDQLSGELMNDATADGKHKKGDPFGLPFEQVFDYLHVKGDGTEEGNETSKFIRNLHRKR